MTKSKLCFIVVGCVGTLVLGAIAYNALMKKKYLYLDCLCDNQENAQV